MRCKFNLSIFFLLLTLVSGSAPIRTAQGQERYGTRVATLSLNNLTVGGEYGYAHAYRIRAKESGRLTGLRAYWIYKYQRNGYHSGNGGVIRVSVRPDDGSAFHLPSETVLASTAVPMKLCTPAQVAAAVGRDRGPCGMEGRMNIEGERMTFKRINFSNGPMLKKGALYHIVFENVDPHPETNWVSLNGLFHPDGLKTLLGGYNPVDDFAALSRYNGGGWTIDDDTMPILSIMLNGGEPKQASGGKEFGLGYVDAWASYNFPPISGRVYAREVFTPTVSRTFSAVNVHAGLISGTGTLFIDLRNSDDKTLQTVKIPSSDLPALRDCPWLKFFGTNPEPNESCGIWVRRAFSQPLSVEAGKRYWIVIRSKGEAKFGVNLLQKGQFYDFGKDTLFNEGYSDMSDDVGATWKPWVMWGQKRSDADLQFFLE